VKAAVQIMTVITEWLLGELQDMYDMGGASTVGELMRRHLGPTVHAYDVDAVEREYLAAVNQRLDRTGLYVDENSDIHADGFVDDDDRELLDVAFFRTDLTCITADHKR
jgi:hypothetical protein